MPGIISTDPSTRTAGGKSGNPVTIAPPAPDGSKSGNPVLRQPLEHLIQHIKQYDPMLYEALKRLSSYTNNNSSIINNINNAITPGAPSTDMDEWVARGILPGNQIVANDVLANRYTIHLESGYKVQFLYAAITAKIAPSIQDYIDDILLTTDNGVTWNSIFPSQITLPATEEVIVITPAFAIPFGNDGDQLRVDVIQADSVVSGIELALIGQLIPK